MLDEAWSATLASSYRMLPFVCLARTTCCMHTASARAVFAFCALITGFTQAEEFPEHLQMQLRLLKNREEQEHAQREMERNMCKVCLLSKSNYRILTLTFPI